VQCSSYLPRLLTFQQPVCTSNLVLARGSLLLVRAKWKHAIFQADNIACLQLRAQRPLTRAWRAARRLERLLALERAMDTVVWQLLASVACPGYTIHTVVALMHAALLPVEARPSRLGLVLSELAGARLLQSRRSECVGSCLSRLAKGVIHAWRLGTAPCLCDQPGATFLHYLCFVRPVRKHRPQAGL